MTDMVDIPHLDGDWAIRMHGDAMTPYLQPGDLLVIKNQNTAEPGQIVVALIDDKAAVRRYSVNGGMVRLEADNPTVETIESPAGDVVIKGRVVGLVRSLT